MMGRDSPKRLGRLSIGDPRVVPNPPARRSYDRAGSEYGARQDGVWSRPGLPLVLLGVRLEFSLVERGLSQDADSLQARVRGRFPPWP